MLNFEPKKILFVGLLIWALFSTQLANIIVLLDGVYHLFSSAVDFQTTGPDWIITNRLFGQPDAGMTAIFHRLMGLILISVTVSRMFGLDKTNKVISKWKRTMQLIVWGTIGVILVAMFINPDYRVALFSLF